MKFFSIAPLIVSVLAVVGTKVHNHFDTRNGLASFTTRGDSVDDLAVRDFIMITADFIMHGDPHRHEHDDDDHFDHKTCSALIARDSIEDTDLTARQLHQHALREAVFADITTRELIDELADRLHRRGPPPSAPKPHQGNSGGRPTSADSRGSSSDLSLASSARAITPPETGSLHQESSSKPSSLSDRVKAKLMSRPPVGPGAEKTPPYMCLSCGTKYLEKNQVHDCFVCSYRRWYNHMRRELPRYRYDDRSTYCQVCQTGYLDMFPSYQVDNCFVCKYNKWLQQRLKETSKSKSKNAGQSDPYPIPKFWKENGFSFNSYGSLTSMGV